MSPAKPNPIRIDVLGDSAWFSKPGRSICYMITVGDGKYLIDIGASPFHTLGIEGLNQVRALFATHSHDDHRRWFSDLALFHFYQPAMRSPIHLYTSQIVHEEYEKNSKAAIERSLNFTSDRLIDIPYKSLVETHLIGPRARYHIDKYPRHAVDNYVWRVYDAQSGNVVDPSKAKVLISSGVTRPRMIFLDDETGHWVEPEAYYDFGDPAFYFAEPNPFIDADSGLKISAIRACAWHGPPVIGLLLETETEKIAFSSDTVFDVGLWRRLSEEVRGQNLEGMSHDEFATAPIIYGDINNFIQRTWSRRRFEAALKAFNGAIVIHDADYAGSVVHTTYEVLAKAYSLGEVDWKRLLLTHTPDSYASAFPILARRKAYLAEGGDIFELVDGRKADLDADLYLKIKDRSYVGYISPSGSHEVYRADGGLKIREANVAGEDDPPMQLRVQLYCDIEGHYFPYIDDSQREVYIQRPGGGYEHIVFEAEGSVGRPAEDLRGDIRATPRRRGSSKTGIIGRM